ncbi:Nn.00g059140.m01.CDS01 [Neocucurbitaria sp. VM-36]
MSLYTLPPELKLNIAECLDPDSSLNLALTCRDLHRVCKSVLREHGRLLLEGHTIDTADPQIASRVLWITLKEVLNDPRKGWYVRELNLPSSRWYHWDRDNLGLLPLNMLAVPPVEDQELFKEAARALRTLYQKTGCDLGGLYGKRFDDDDDIDLIKALEERIVHGFDDAIIAVLIHHLPYIKKIRITDVEDDVLELMMQHIAATYKHPSKRRRLPFQHLTTAAVVHWDSEMCSNADWACEFLAIPSVRSFAAYQMGNSPSFGVGRGDLLTDDAYYSNVTELFFFSCQFNVEGLEVILAAAKNLKKLTYTGGGATVSESAWYEPKKVIAAVTKHVGHSLEELELDLDEFDADFGDEEDLASVSLRDFKKLRSLNCEWRMLLPNDKESYDDAPLQHGFRTEDKPAAGFDVRDILPESLQELYLHGVFEDADWEELTELLKSPNPATPNIDKMCIRNLGGGQPYVMFGDAPPPRDLYSNPLARLFQGHGY